MKDKEFLQWIHDRLVHVHGESEYVDYMHKLRAIIAATDPEQLTPNTCSTRGSNIMGNITDDFTITPDGSMAYHGDKPVNANMIFNPGDSLVRASVEDKAEYLGANESLVNLNPKVVEPVDELIVENCTFTVSDESHSPAWIVWEGGECPVDHDLEVVVRLRDGRELTSEAGEANGFVWSHGSKLYGYEIIAYRPNYPELLVNPLKDDGVADHELDGCVSKSAETDAQADLSITDEKQPTWNGEGLPPVGTVCGFNASPSGDPRWTGAKIVGEFEGKVVFFTPEDGIDSDNNRNLYQNSDQRSFRPIKSDKQIQVEKLSIAIKDFEERYDSGVYGYLDKYRAIAALLFEDTNCRIQESDDE